MTYDSSKETLEHIQVVRNGIGRAVSELMHRAEIHDVTKMGENEKPIFDEFTGKLKGSTYGSDEYKGFLKAMEPALKHHYASHRHHPEHGFTDEIWKDICGFEDSHEVSNFGRIRSKDRYVSRNNTDLLKKGQFITLNVTPKGYLRFQITSHGKRNNLLVHRAVAESFIGPPPQEDYQINHKDGDKKNNHISNLEWVTQSENMNHAYENDLKQSCPKYLVECEELNLCTIGMDEMAKRASKAIGKTVRPSGIWRVAHNGGSHCGLSFTASLLKEHNSDLKHMDFIDILEMMIDWYSATKRHDDGDIYKSIELNQKRFKYSDDVKASMVRTADWLVRTDPTMKDDPVKEMQKEIKNISCTFPELLDRAESEDDMGFLKSAFLGKKSKLTDILKTLGKVPAAKRKDIGEQLNTLRASMDDLWNDRFEELELA